MMYDFYSLCLAGCFDGESPLETIPRHSPSELLILFSNNVNAFKRMANTGSNVLGCGDVRRGSTSSSSSVDEKLFSQALAWTNDEESAMDNYLGSLSSNEMSDPLTLNRTLVVTDPANTFPNEALAQPQIDFKSLTDPHNESIRPMIRQRPVSHQKNPNKKGKMTNISSNKLPTKTAGFECEICGSRLKLRRDFTRHMKGHESKIACTHCSRKFTRVDAMKRHLKICFHRY